MSIFLLKSLLSLLVVLSTIFAMFTMFEIFGRSEKRFDVERLKRLHRANGVFFLLLYAGISFFCLQYLLDTKVELSSRATFHALFALTVILLLAVKILFVRVYRQFYGQVKIIGLVVALVAFGMVATSSGYYLLVTKWGTERAAVTALPADQGEPWLAVELRTDGESIGRGEELYSSKCFQCHDPGSTATIVGPGHQGILKRPSLPTSGWPATPENVARQIISPYDKMPSFAYLSRPEIEDIIAYLNTL